MRHYIPRRYVPGTTTLLLTEARKMPCASWSLPAREACPYAFYGEDTICGNCLLPGPRRPGAFTLKGLAPIMSNSALDRWNNRPNPELDEPWIQQETCSHPANSHCVWPADMPGSRYTCSAIIGREAGSGRALHCPCTSPHAVAQP